MAVDQPARCANCDAPVPAMTIGPHCTVCGARVTPTRLTFRGIAATSFEHVLSADPPLLRTLIDLFRFPGRVASDYLAGRRLKYASPLKFNLLTAAVTMAVINLVLARMPHAPPVADQATVSAGRQLLREAVVLSQSWQNHYLQVLYAASLPLLAWLLKLMPGRGSSRNAMDFYVMGLYSFGQIYLLQAACGLTGYWLRDTPGAVVCGVLAAALPFWFFPWMATGFCPGRPVRTALLSSAALILFGLIVSTVLLGAAAVWLAATHSNS